MAVRFEHQRRLAQDEQRLQLHKHKISQEPAPPLYFVCFYNYEDGVYNFYCVCIMSIVCRHQYKFGITEKKMSTSIRSFK